MKKRSQKNYSLLPKYSLQEFQLVNDKIVIQSPFTRIDYQLLLVNLNRKLLHPKTVSSVISRHLYCLLKRPKPSNTGNKKTNLIDWRTTGFKKGVQ